MARPVLIPAALLALGGTAQALDCAKARPPLETAICADPAAKASDEAMAAAFEQARTAAAPDQRQSILDDQRAWLKQRNLSCASESGAASCIAQANRARAGILLARPESGPGYAPPPIPVFVRQAGSRTKVEVGVQLYRFAEPRNAGERLLNAQADKTVAAIPWKKDEPDDRDWSHDVAWTIAYASPGFLSIQVSSWDFSGGAHGSSGVGGLTFDMAGGRLLAFSDLFDGRARTEIGRLCFDQLMAEKKTRGAEGDDEPGDLRARMDEVLKDLGAWTFAQDKATVHFDPYTVGAYAEGPYACELPMQRLAPLSKIPLPPR